MQTSKRTIWESYARAWKEESAEAKTASLQHSVAPDCLYTDPLAIARGHDELVRYMLEFHKQVPGGHFITKFFLEHHGVSIAQWNMAAGDGTLIGEGISYGEYREDGRLVAMTGFFEVPQQGG